MGKRRAVSMSVLPGEKTDGSGRVCIHLFVRDDRGMFSEPHVLHPAKDENGEEVKGRLEAYPTKGRLACDPKRSFYPNTRNGVTSVTSRTESTAAVTCPRCLASDDYKRLTNKG